MKIIDLLNKIANGEEVPKKIKFNDEVYKYHDKEHGYCKYHYNNTYICLNSEYYLFDILNDEVEILDNEEKEKPLTKKDVEALGYACGEIKKCFENGWNKSLENKPFKEDKKIEKIDIKWDKDYYVLDENNVKKYLNERDKIEMNKINEIIDYLKSKGE